MHIVYDSLGTCRDSVVQAVTLTFTPTCQASFYVQYDSVNYNYGFYFISNSTYTGTGISSYTWTVDGVNQSTNYSVLTVYPSPGLHTVCLTILTAAGCTSAYCQTITAPPSCNVIPSFTYLPDTVNRRKISFTPSSNLASLRYYWNFGDGYSSLERMPVHSYYYPGVYSVKLIIRDTGANCLDSVRQNITVQAMPSDSCTASYSYSLNNYGLAFFTAISNQIITSQNWLIFNYRTGDSVLINANNPSYQFMDTGYYLVCVTLTTNTGCVRTYCDNIQVSSISGRPSSNLLSYPNPVDGDVVRINVNMETPASIYFKIYSLNGNIIYQSQKAGQPGSNIIAIPVQQLNRGQYFVEIIFGEQRKRSIFQKL